jgi:hypothetical protein
VLASKERLYYMYFRNCLPIFSLLEGRTVFFLTPIPRYLYTSCCERPDHAPNRTGEDFEAVFRKSLMECRSYYKIFFFTSGCKKINIIDPGLCVPREDEEGYHAAVGSRPCPSQGGRVCQDCELHLWGASPAEREGEPQEAAW